MASIPAAHNNCGENCIYQEQDAKKREYGFRGISFRLAECFNRIQEKSFNLGNKGVNHNIP